MTFLRLGVNCAVVDDEGRVLLSQRSDLDVWNLPGGRVDPGEGLEAAALRELREETGVIAQIDHPVGLYYLHGWERLNVLYSAWPLSEDLKTWTNETKDNRYFSLRALPAEVTWEWLLFDVMADERPMPRIIEMPADELRQIKRKLARRWVRNLLSGRPEPRFPRFDVWAVGLVWDSTHTRVVTLAGGQGQVLPRAVCTGEQSPWDELRQAVHGASGVEPVFQWVGVWQDVGHDSLEFVFAATVDETDLSGQAEWSNTRNTALTGLDAAYVERVKASYATDPVWTINHDADIKAGEIFRYIR